MKHDNVDGATTARNRFLRTLTVVCAMAALAALIAGSIYMAMLFTQGDNALEAVFFVWPVLLLGVWLVGSITMVPARQWRNLAGWTLVCVIAGLGFPLMALNSGTADGNRTTSILDASLFMVDVGIVYCGWRLILHQYWR